MRPSSTLLRVPPTPLQFSWQRFATHSAGPDEYRNALRVSPCHFRIKASEGAPAIPDLEILFDLSCLGKQETVHRCGNLVLDNLYIGRLLLQQVPNGPG